MKQRLLFPPKQKDSILLGLLVFRVFQDNAQVNPTRTLNLCAIFLELAGLGLGVCCSDDV
jgi:hypothetical protein